MLKGYVYSYTIRISVSSIAYIDFCIKCSHSKTNLILAVQGRTTAQQGAWLGNVAIQVVRKHQNNKNLTPSPIVRTRTHATTPSWRKYFCLFDPLSHRTHTRTHATTPSWRKYFCSFDPLSHRTHTRTHATTPSWRKYFCLFDPLSISNENVFKYSIINYIKKATVKRLKDRKIIIAKVL